MKAFEKVRARLETDIRRGRYPSHSLLPTISELATHHGCAVGTVRRAIDDLKQAGIVDAVKKRGTVVLRRPALGRVPLLLSPDAHANSLLQGPVCAALGAADYDVDMLTTDVGPAAFDSWCQRLQHDPRPPLALVVIGGQTPATQDTIRTYFPRRIVVSLDGTGEELDKGVSCVVVDWMEEVRCLLAFLREQGHERVGIWAGHTRFEDSRYTRIAKTLASASRESGGICHLQYGEDGRHRLPDIARTLGITAYVDLNDHFAITTLHVLMDAGLTVPEDISLIGRHNTPWVETTQPALTSLSVNPEGMAEAVVQAVTDIVNEEQGHCYAISPFVVARGSTKARNPAHVSLQQDSHRRPKG